MTIHKTDSPFIALITFHPLPHKFRMPQLDSYDGSWDPYDHVATFKTTMYLQGILDEIMCKAFPTRLKGLGRIWFNKLPLNTIPSFKELSKLLINNFIGSQRHKCPSFNFLQIKQGENESLRSFVSHFNKEALLVGEVDNNVLLTAFQNGVTSNLFIH